MIDKIAYMHRVMIMDTLPTWYNFMESQLYSMMISDKFRYIKG